MSRSVIESRCTTGTYRGMVLPQSHLWRGKFKSLLYGSSVRHVAEMWFNAVQQRNVPDNGEQGMSGLKFSWHTNFYGITQINSGCSNLPWPAQMAAKFESRENCVEQWLDDPNSEIFYHDGIRS